MFDLIDDLREGENVLEFFVIEFFGVIKKFIEGMFSYVWIWVEIGWVSFLWLGYVYLDLKDDKLVIFGVIWKGVVLCLLMCFEEGMEVVVIGWLIMFGG